MQGRAMDAARANVEQHYSFIFGRHSDFMRRQGPASTLQQPGQMPAWLKPPLILAQLHMGQALAC